MRFNQDLHLFSQQLGHAADTDCWCEPIRIYAAVINGLPGLTRVIEHENIAEQHHLVVVSIRERDSGDPCPDYREDYESAITRALTPPWSPPLLPPHENRSF